jgi:hypothetical protein
MTKYEKLKLSLLTFFVVGFLLCFYNYSQNGRYVFNEDDFLLILDTRTGTIYSPKNKISLKIDKYQDDKEQPKPKKK